MFMPAILYIVALVGLPFAMAFVYSVGDVKVGSVGYHFVGLQNFISVLHSPTFRRAGAQGRVSGAAVDAISDPAAVGGAGVDRIHRLEMNSRLAIQRRELGAGADASGQAVRYAGLAGRAEARDDVGDPGPHVAHAAVRDRDPSRRPDRHSARYPGGGGGRRRR